MNKISSIILIAILCLVAIVYATDNNESKVIILNETNFDSIIKSQPYTLVKFYAPWCGHCKSLAEPYKLAAEKLHNKAKIAEVDCTLDESKSLCSKYGVGGYPTIYGFTSDLVKTEYDDGRTTDAIIAHVLAATSPAIIYITTQDELNEFKSGPLDIKLIITTSSKDNNIIKIVENVSKTLRKITAIGIDLISSKDTTNNKDTITLYRTFDEPEIKYDGDVSKINEKDLIEFVTKNTLPLIGEIGPHNYKKYTERNLPLIWMFLNYDDNEQVQLITKDFITIAKEYQNKILFAKLDGKKWEKHAKTFGLEKSTPGIVLEERTSKKKYLYPHSSTATLLTKDEFKSWIEKYLQGELKPTIKSEPIPEDNTKPVTIIVGTTFDSIVLNDKKDVFVKFYAPWCGHCKAMIPAYEELGEKFKDDDNIIIAKFNGADNDSSASSDIQGYPTILFYKEGDKTKPITYKGERTATAMAEFIEKNRITTPKKVVPITTSRDDL